MAPLQQAHDYTAISATQLTISAGDTTATFNVGVLADSLDEANETVTLTLSSVSSTATISDATGTLTITDDDATPSLSINDVTAANENAANSTFTVTLSAVPPVETSLLTTQLLMALLQPELTIPLSVATQLTISCRRYNCYLYM